MRIKLTQTTVKYFIVTNVAYSDPDTTVTVYGGTDYTLTSADITSPYYSMQKAPQGFPLDQGKWTVEVSDTTKRSQASPTNTVWYNLGSLTISVPIGIWKLSYSVIIAPYFAGSTLCDQFTTLSTANNSESDVGFTSASYLQGATGTLFFRATVYREKVLTVASKTSYYLNAKTTSSSQEIAFENALGTMYLRAVCVYL